MQEQVHRAQARNAVDQLNAEERAALELLLLFAVELVMLRNEIMRREQETAFLVSIVLFVGLWRHYCDES